MSDTPTKPTLRTVVADWVPTRPAYNLADEPWIDVTDLRSGSDAQVGLRDALHHADTFQLDGNPRGHLWEHATHRFLIALTYLLHAHAPNHPWGKVADGTAPLPADAIDTVLDRLADHLWLHHPTRPFLQDPSVLDVIDGKPHKDPLKALQNNTGEFWSLLPHVPSNTNTAWFARAEQWPAPTAADAANALLLRHYFAMPGNETPNRGAAGKTTKGGVTYMTHNGRSFATVVGPNLAATLTRNLLDDWVDTIGPDTPTFFEQPHTVGPNLQPTNPLWAYTATGAATVLLPTPQLAAPYRAIRTPVPHGKQTSEALAETMRSNDPHSLRVDPRDKNGARSYLQLSTAGSDLHLVRRFYDDLVNQSALHQPCVLSPRALAYGNAGRDVQILVLDGAGNSMAPRVRASAVFRPPAGVFTTNPDRMARYLELTNRVSGDKASASSKVAYRVSQVLTSGNAPGRLSARHKLHPWLAPACDEHLTAATEPVLRDLLHRCIDPDQPLPDELNDTQRAAVTGTALEVFDQLVAPYTDRPTAVAHQVQQRNLLRRDLNQLWSATP